MTAGLEAASMFTDHMVLQQMCRIPVWGRAPAGSRVTVWFAEQAASAEACQDGTWMLELEPVAAGGPYCMEIECGVQTVVFRDVWVGEVWLAGGQSNMVMQLLFTEGGVEESESASVFPLLRFFTTPRRPFEGARVPCWDFIGTFTEPASWQVCSPRSALHFTAIGYYFGKLLQQAKGVPVGIISCNFGGTPAQSWMSEEALCRDQELRPLLDNYLAYCAKLDPQQYEREFNEFVQLIYRLIDERGDIERRVRELGLDGYRGWIVNNPLILPDPPKGPKAYQRPCGFYRTMLRTVVPYAIRGVLWYQGESNDSLQEAPLYRKLLTALIENWREDWGRPDLPFLLVQLTSYVSLNGRNGTEWAHIREAQEAVADTVPNTAMVVTIDLGEHDIHPILKRPIAERLFRAAQSVVYGEPVDYKATRCKNVRFGAGKAVVEFDDVGDGLQALSDPLEGFDICGEDRVFVPAVARLAGTQQVEVSHPQTAEPVAVRYAWRKMPRISLIGKNGLPVAPFRTDDYPLQDANS